MHDPASELLRIPLPCTRLNKGKRARTVGRPGPLRGYRLPLLGGGVPYLAIHPLQQRLAPLASLLVVANHLQLLHRKPLQAPQDLIHVHLVVALYREGRGFGCPLGSRGRSTMARPVASAMAPVAAPISPVAVLPVAIAPSWTVCAARSVPER
jgi:hypothetical protein